MMTADFAEALKRDRRSGTPLYVQVREELREAIASGRLKPGDQLPTEGELEQQLKVSRSTIRQAMGDLVTEGVINRAQGKGTFVTTPKVVQRTPFLTSFTDLLLSQGRQPSHELLETGIQDLPREPWPDTRMTDAVKCRFLGRILYADGDPIGMSKTWLSLKVIGSHDSSIVEGVSRGESLYQVLETESDEFVPHRATETIRPSQATSNEAQILQCDPGDPLLLILWLTYNIRGQPLEWSRLVFLPETYEYSVDLERSPYRTVLE